MTNQDVHSTSHPRKFFGRKGIVLLACSALLILCSVLAFISSGRSQGAHADSSSFTQGASSTSNTQAQLWLKPSGWTAGYVIGHYTVDGGMQQNVNMTYNGGTSHWEYTIGGLKSGNVISYSFTYQQNQQQYDTGSYSYTVGTTTPTPTPTVGGPAPTSTSTSVPTPRSPGGAGTFPLTLQNNTHGKWSNNQIYITILGQATPGQWSYLLPNGTFTHLNHLDANAPNHLTKNGTNYANMAFTMDQTSTITMPTSFAGTRMYVSLGAPMYIPIANDDSGWGGPDLSNPNDPNATTYFDWYELAYTYGSTPFGGNTTQVDQFGFPMTVRLQQASSGFDQTNGISLSRDQVYSQYAASVGPAFASLSTPYRILAPKSSSAFYAGGSQANYMQSYIDQTWNYYTNNQFNLSTGGAKFSGKVVNGQLQFTVDGSGSYVVKKPTSSDVLACEGALSAGVPRELQLEAALCAALNRGVAQNTADWTNVGAYYGNAANNDYAKFWHQVSINKKAYGFAYDDVNAQSSVEILPNSDPPSNLTIGIGW